MAADSVLRLKVDDREYNATLRDARKGLLELEKTLEATGKSFSDCDKSVVEYIGGLGRMVTQSTTARGKVSELSNAFLDLSAQYSRMSDAAKQSDAGRAMAQSLETLKQRTIEAKRELSSLNAELDSTPAKAQALGKSMPKLSFGSIAGQLGSLGSLGSLAGMAASAGPAAAAIGGVGVALAGLKTAIEDNVRTAMGFERSMSMLSALTGMTGKDLERLKESAIELGGSTTLSASQVADAFRLIGSQMPVLLSSVDAMRGTTKAVIRLSEAAGIDLQTASQTVATSVNQFGGDASKAAEYVNVLAAASQKGAGDIAWLGTAITNSGTAANAVGTSYEELVANLEMLAKGGFDASSAGTALRSIIMNLEKQANDKFKPSIVGLTEAFKNMGDAQMTLTEYQDIAGKLFASQAKILSENAREAESLTAAITGTSTAEDQASTNTANLDGALKSLSSAWEAFNLHLNSSNSILTSVVNVMTDVVRHADNISQKYSAINDKIDELEQKNGFANMALTIARVVGPLSNVYTLLREINAALGNTPDAGPKAEQADKVQKSVENRLANVRNKRTREERVVSIASQEDELDSRIEKAQRAADRKSSQISANGGTAGDREELRRLLDVVSMYKQERESFTKQAAEILNPKGKGDGTVAPPPPPSTSTTTTTTTKTHTATPQERATAKYEQAEKDYEQALAFAALELKNGGISEGESLKQRKQAQDTLWKAIGDAREIYDSPELKTAQDALEKEMAKLTPTLKASLEREKALSDAKRQLEQAEKKLSEAYDEQSNARDLKERYAAEKKVANAERDVETARAVVSRAETAPKVAIPDVTAEVSVTADVSEAVEAVNDAAKEIEGKEIKLKPVVAKVSLDTEALTGSNLQAFINKIKGDLESSDIGSGLYNGLTKQLADANALSGLIQTCVKNGISTADFDVAGIWQKIFSLDGGGDAISDETWQKIEAEINAKLKDLNLPPIKLNVDTGQVSQDGKQVKATWQDAARAVASVGSALQGLEDPGVKIMGIVGAAIANIALGFAQATAKDSTLGVFGWIAAIAGGLGTMLSTISAIHSATGYSNGGIIEGSTRSGDQIMANGGGDLIGLNAGEVVLNQAQAGVLASQLQSASGGGGGGGYGVRVSGEQIWLALGAYTRRTGKGEIVTSR